MYDVRGLIKITKLNEKEIFYLSKQFCSLRL